MQPDTANNYDWILMDYKSRCLLRRRLYLNKDTVLCKEVLQFFIS